MMFRKNFLKIYVKIYNNKLTDWWQCVGGHWMMLEPSWSSKWIDRCGEEHTVSHQNDRIF